jgi:soluble lytic murein transglycosylase-like protein
MTLLRAAAAACLLAGTPAAAERITAGDGAPAAGAVIDAAAPVAPPTPRPPARPASATAQQGPAQPIPQPRPDVRTADASSGAVGPRRAVRPADRGRAPAGSAAGLPSGLLAEDAGPAVRRHLLSAADVERYRRAFAAVADADWDAADAALAGVSDGRLVGHVLQRRLMHPTGWRASFAELSGWLDAYADHPGADAVHRLALRRLPRGERPPRQPEDASGLVGGNLEDYDGHRPLDVRPRARAPRGGTREDAVLERVGRLLARGAAQEAEAALEEAADALSATLLAQARADVAAGLFYEGRPRDALRVAAAAAAGAEGGGPALARWIGGLAAWRLGRHDLAARHFEATATGADVSAWDVSAGAFWAARAHMRAGRPHLASGWLERAAAYPRSFYGLIASRMLGRDDGFLWEVPALSARHLDALAARPAGRRALALLQVGERDLAEAELRRLHPGGDQAAEEALLAVSVRARMPALALRVGNAVAAPDGATWDAALYPLPPWEPEDGFRIDRALVFALMRQESRFEPSARSRAGASGLMQLMPATARSMAGDDLPRERLFDPGVNVTLGQRYVAHLIEQPEIGANLVRVLAAYNAGPANLARWSRAMGDVDDPLMFVESLPSRETRTFVERVLANFWIYRLRLGEPTPTLDDVAAGRWPAYLPADEGLLEVAAGDDERAH